MPRKSTKADKKINKTTYTKIYNTEGQTVSNDGDWITMPDGARFKRVVLKSSAVRVMNNDAEEVEDALNESEDYVKEISDD